MCPRIPKSQERSWAPSRIPGIGKVPEIRKSTPNVQMFKKGNQSVQKLTSNQRNILTRIEIHFTYHNPPRCEIQMKPEKPSHTVVQLNGDITSYLQHSVGHICEVHRLPVKVHSPDAEKHLHVAEYLSKVMRNVLRGVCVDLFVFRYLEMFVFWLPARLSNTCCSCVWASTWNFWLGRIRIGFLRGWTGRRCRSSSRPIRILKR